MNNKQKVRMFFKSLLLQLSEVETDKAKLIFDAPELVEGVEVFIEGDGENEDYVPAPDGEYKTNDNKVIKVENGVVVEVIDTEAEVAPEEETPIVEEMEEETPIEETPTPTVEENNNEEVAKLREEMTELYNRVAKLEESIAELAKVEGAKPVEEQFNEIEKKAKTSKTEQMLSFLKK